MHFFRIQIKRNRKSRRPPSTTNEQEQTSMISGRRVQEPSSTSPPQRRWRDSLWQILPFHNQVSQSIDLPVDRCLHVAAFFSNRDCQDVFGKIFSSVQKNAATQ